MKLLDALKTPAARVPRPGAGESEILDLPDPEIVTIPVEYPGRLVLRPLVQAGEQVARNQVIGRSEQGNCVHASIGGKVREITRIWTASGHHVPAVVIERGDVSDLTPTEAITRSGLHPASATRLQLLKAGGVISPWTTPGLDHAESSVADHPDILHLIILGHDEEPTQHVQELLLQNRASVLQDGLRLLSDLAPHAQVSLTVPRRLAGWARETFGEGLRIVGVSDEYRRRLERVLIPQLANLEVPATATYRSRGIGAMSVETVTTAQDALKGRPFVRKTLTVSGGALDKPRTVRAALGTSIKTILEACGLVAEDAGRLLASGPMRGVALYTPETPLDKFQHGIHLLAPENLPAEVNLPCVNCGRCVRACPSHIQMHLIGRCVEFGLLAEANEKHPDACHECGLCAFVCPARRPLVQLVRLAKTYRRKP